MDTNDKIVLGAVAGFATGAIMSGVRTMLLRRKALKIYKILGDFTMEVGGAIDEMANRGIEIPEDIVEKIVIEGKFAEIAMDQV